MSICNKFDIPISKCGQRINSVPVWLKGVHNFSKIMKNKCKNYIGKIIIKQVSHFRNLRIPFTDYHLVRCSLTII